MPFNSCIDCPKLGNGCHGPNFFSLSATELLEWCKLRMKSEHITQAYLAEQTKTSAGTIASVFSKGRADFMYETMRPIIRYLVGGDFQGNPCPDPSGDLAAKIEELKEKNESLRSVIKENKAAYDADLQREREDAARREKYFEKQMRTRMIFIIILSVLLGLALAVIISALLIDHFNPEKGFFWLEDIFSPSHQFVSNRLCSLINKFM